MAYGISSKFGSSSTAAAVVCQTDTFLHTEVDRRSQPRYFSLMEMN
jgi:hypothetical protein